MDVSKTSTTEALEARYATLARKTMAAIQAEGPPATGNAPPAVSPSLPSLPRYEPPPPPPKYFSDRYQMVCRMFFPTSGHRGFDTLKQSTEFPPIDIVRQMILYETQLRLSNSIQDIMDEYRDDEADVTYVHELIQKHVVEYFGYHDVNALRTALSRFPDDPVVQSAFYIKYNQISQGLVAQNQCARDVILYTVDGQPTNLALVRSHVPNGICFLAVYIAEAHSRDQWPVGKTISCVDQPTTMEQRLENARQFKNNFNFEMPMLVDTMENTFHHTYGSWPFRFYVIHEGKLVLKAEPNCETFAYDLENVDNWINCFYQTRSQTV